MTSTAPTPEQAELDRVVTARPTGTQRPPRPPHRASAAAAARSARAALVIDRPVCRATGRGTQSAAQSRPWTSAPPSSPEPAAASAPPPPAASPARGFHVVTSPPVVPTGSRPSPRRSAVRRRRLRRHRRRSRSPRSPRRSVDGPARAGEQRRRRLRGRPRRRRPTPTTGARMYDVNVLGTAARHPGPAARPPAPAATA